MASQIQIQPLILVVEDVHETRDGIERLLKGDGYRVDVARDGLDAIASVQRARPNLILLSLGGLPREVIAIARRITNSAGQNELGEVPVVLFCIPELHEGDEVHIGSNMYVTRPDNFNQLRGLLTRVLAQASLSKTN